MTPTERSILAAARRWMKSWNCCTTAKEVGAADDALYNALTADAAARKKSRKKSPKWKPETPSPYDLSEGKRK